MKPEMATASPTQYPVLGLIIESIAAFFARQSHKLAASRQMDALGEDEASAIARELGISRSQLRLFSLQEQGTPKFLKSMLSALRIDPEDFAEADTNLRRDMESLCSVCASKRRCRRALRTGTAAATFRQFCPNASNLEMLPIRRAALRSAPLAYI